MTVPAGLQRRRFRVEGAVQGVGFRPWVHGLAHRHDLAGFVLNDGRGVVIEAEGPEAALEEFQRGVLSIPAPGAVDRMQWQSAPATGERGFTVAASDAAVPGAMPVGADLATCADCLRELLDPADRRHRYPLHHVQSLRPSLHRRPHAALRPRAHRHGGLRAVRPLSQRYLAPVAMPGGEAAIREPWRMAGAYLEAADRPVPWERWRLVRQALGVNAPARLGAGRLLDAVSALLGVREAVSYEGQAAIELEHLAGDAAAEPYACRRVGPAIVGADLIRAAHDDLDAGRPRALIAAAVQEGLASAFADACLDAGGPSRVVLSGGCLQNARLAASLRARLKGYGYMVLTHSRVPAGDGGISYGQAAIAAARTG